MAHRLYFNCWHSFLLFMHWKGGIRKERICLFAFQTERKMHWLWASAVHMGEKIYFIVQHCLLILFNFQAEQIMKKYSMSLCRYYSREFNCIRIKAKLWSLRNCNLTQNTELFWNDCHSAPLQKIREASHPCSCCCQWREIGRMEIRTSRGWFLRWVS